jgi:hypothetical protein
MKFILWAVACASLAGCAVPTMTEMRQKEPRQVMHSTKTDKVLADCVQKKWQELPVFEGKKGATQEPGSHGGYTVASVGEAYFADIQSEGAGTVAKYYSATYLWISKKHEEAVQECL